MSAPTPGRAAYEAFWTRESGFVVTPWGEAVPQSEREAWEAAAQAAIGCYREHYRDDVVDDLGEFL